jgi:hypothetical protein
MMLANLAMVTRPASEIADLDAAAQWAGMPDYDDDKEQQIQITVHFASDADRTEFARLLGLDATMVRTHRTLWWPNREKDDVRNVRFTNHEDAR